MSQAQIAELAGVGIRAVSEMERGKSTLRMDVANAILGVFGKTLGVVDADREGDAT
jgi:transcriptional regulator with XRE-family HTH domain